MDNGICQLQVFQLSQFQHSGHDTKHDKYRIQSKKDKKLIKHGYEYKFWNGSIKCFTISYNGHKVLPYQTNRKLLSVPVSVDLITRLLTLLQK